MGGFGKWLNHEGEVLSNGISDLTKETPQSFQAPSTTWGCNEKAETWKRAPHWTMLSPWPQPSSLQTVSNGIFVYKPPGVVFPYFRLNVLRHIYFFHFIFITSTTQFGPVFLLSGPSPCLHIHSFLVSLKLKWHICFPNASFSLFLFFLVWQDREATLSGTNAKAGSEVDPFIENKARLSFSPRALKLLETKATEGHWHSVRTSCVASCPLSRAASRGSTGGT